MPTNKAEIDDFRLSVMCAIPASPQAKTFYIINFAENIVCTRNMRHVCISLVMREDGKPAADEPTIQRGSQV